VFASGFPARARIGKTPASALRNPLVFAIRWRYAQSTISNAILFERIEPPCQRATHCDTFTRKLAKHSRKGVARVHGPGWIALHSADV
jgi:hypothetical protein